MVGYGSEGIKGKIKMKLKFRNTNSNERYAASKKAVKHYFGTEDKVFISFGFLGKSFSFDYMDKKHPKILGDVIVSASSYSQVFFP